MAERDEFLIHNGLLILLVLLFTVFLLVMAGQKLRISYPIFLVIGGLLIGFIPGIPLVTIDPKIIFLIFLPPLLYEAAWFTSWHEFWRWRRVIFFMAFGLVLFTSGIIAFVSSEMIPGFTLALGFLLGGIISPPDAVAASSVLKGIKVPRRIISILEGESLLNDASSLVVFRFALAAVVSGTFVWKEAATDFLMVTVMGAVIGLAIAHIMYVIHRWFPTTPSMDSALTFMSPYFMYLGAEQFHYSGVMAVVCGGLFLSYRAHEILTPRARIQAYGLWSTLTFILNGLVFILIGLQLPIIVNSLGNYSIAEAVKYGLVISLVAIVIRFVWMFPAAFIPRLLSRKIRNRASSPGWKEPTVVAWAGMRGVVSLASALSVPLMLNDSTAFPQRNLILFITFVVIFITLVVQGLTLPLIVKWLNMKDTEFLVPVEEDEANLRLLLIRASLERLDTQHNRYTERNSMVRDLKTQLQGQHDLHSLTLSSIECATFEKQEISIYKEVMADIFSVQRKTLIYFQKHNTYRDDLLRSLNVQLDLEEARFIKQFEDIEEAI